MLLQNEHKMYVTRINITETCLYLHLLIWTDQLVNLYVIPVERYRFIVFIQVIGDPGERFSYHFWPVYGERGINDI